MFLAELIYDRNALSKKIEELKEHLLFIADTGKFSDQNKAQQVLRELFDCVERNQSKNMLINNLINTVEINVGNSKTKMSNVIELRNSLEFRINVLSDLIKTCKLTDSRVTFDLYSLIEDKDKLSAELVNLNKILDNHGWNVSIQNKESLEQEEVDDNEEDVG
jgi:hypothetical protein